MNKKNNFLLGFILLLFVSMGFTSCSSDDESSEKSIVSFTIEGVSATISDNEVNLTLPWGVSLAALKPEIKVSAGATVKPGSGVIQDFTSPVTYTVTAEDGSTKTYTVNVINGKRTNKAITSFVFKDFNPIVAGIIDENAKSIVATIPYGTNKTALTPTIEISAGATISPASAVATNFTSPVIYTVTAEDGSTQQYTITVQNSPFNTRIDGVSSKNITVGNNITITGYFAESGNSVQLSLDSVNFITLSNVTETLSSITSTVATTVNSGSYTLFVTSNGSRVSYSDKITVTNPNQPQITGSDKTSYISGVDLSIVLTGKNLKPESGTPKVSFYDFTSGTKITDVDGTPSDDGKQVTVVIPSSLTPKKYRLIVELPNGLKSNYFDIEIVNL